MSHAGVVSRLVMPVSRRHPGSALAFSTTLAPGYALALTAARNVLSSEFAGMPIRYALTAPNGMVLGVTTLFQPAFSRRLSTMLLAEPPETDYDLRFMLLGFPVRVAWTFWLGAIAFGYEFCRAFALLSGNPVDPYSGGNLGMGPLLVVWTLCLFLSILIHELGHALAFRRYGIQSSIVLYHFGGLAVPTSSYTPGRSIARMREKEDLVVAAAGPALQLLSAAALIMIFKLAGYQIAIFNNMPAFLSRVPWLAEGNMIDSEGLYALVSFYVFPSVVWALLNLVPVWPLDGGRIARSLIVINGGTIAQSLWVSVICSGALAIYAFQNHQTFMGIFFLMFAFSSYQMINPMGNSWR